MPDPACFAHPVVFSLARFRGYSASLQNRSGRTRSHHEASATTATTTIIRRMVIRNRSGLMVRPRRGNLAGPDYGEITMKRITTLLAPTFLLLAAPSLCLASMQIEQVSKERAKKLGMELR